MFAGNVLPGAEVQIHSNLNRFEYQSPLPEPRRILAITDMKITKNIKINMLGQHPTI